MKIADFKERAQIILGLEKETEDGDTEIEWEDGKWIWAKITPKITSNYKAFPKEISMINKYELVMRKNYTRYTRHALKIRIRWKHKLLEIISPWQETQDFHFVTAIAILKKELQND